MAKRLTFLIVVLLLQCGFICCVSSLWWIEVSPRVQNCVNSAVQCVSSIFLGQKPADVSVEALVGVCHSLHCGGFVVYKLGLSF